MKKLLYVIAIFAAAVSAASCKEEGFLDKTPLDKLTEDAVFNSTGLAENHVNSMYSVLPDFYQEGNIGCISDEGYFRYGGTSTRYIANGDMDPDNIVYMEEGGKAHNNRTTVLNIWNRAYSRLRAGKRLAARWKTKTVTGCLVRSITSGRGPIPI